MSLALKIRETKTSRLSGKFTSQSASEIWIRIFVQSSCFSFIIKKLSLKMDPQTAPDPKPDFTWLANKSLVRGTSVATRKLVAGGAFRIFSKLCLAANYFIGTIR